MWIPKPGDWVSYSVPYPGNRKHKIPRVRFKVGKVTRRYHRIVREYYYCAMLLHQDYPQGIYTNINNLRPA